LLFWGEANDPYDGQGGMTEGTKSFEFFYRRTLTTAVWTKYCFALTLAFFTINAWGAEDYTTQGKEFWVSFFSQSVRDDESQDLFVSIAARRDCSGTIESADGGWSAAFTISAGEVRKISVPKERALMQSEYDTVYTSRRGLRISTTDTVAVYAGNYQQHSFDAAAVLPVTSLSDEYIATTYHATDVSATLVVATEDGTTIRFTPSNPIRFLKADESEELYESGVTYERTLQRGECLLLAASCLMGTRIEALDCKKVAVFSGNYCPYVPSTCPACDLLMEQVPPLSAWGRQFVVVPTLQRERDSRVVMLPSAENTTLTLKIDGRSQSLTFSPGQYVEIELGEKDVFISATDAISVTQYAIGSSCSGSGDPMMMWINPLEQSITDVVFSPCPSAQITNHYALVIAQTEKAAKTTLDGTNIGNLFALCEQSPDYSFARIPVTIGAHRLSNEEGIMVYAYGYAGGEGSQQYESYGYYCGASQKNVRDHFELSGGTTDLMPDEEAELLITIGSDDVNNVKVTLNGDDITSRLPAISTQKGTQSVMIGNESLREGENVINVTFSRKCQTTEEEKTICRAFSKRLSATICHGNTYIFEGQTLTTSGEYNAVVKKGNSCDTLKTLDLIVRDENIEYRVVELLWGDTCWIDGKGYTKVGTYEHHFTDRYGCDSTLYTTIVRKWTSCPDVKIPSFFSPNGDGENDRWRIENITCYEKAAVRIYDRYSKLLATLDTEEALNKGWDGTYRGMPVPQDTYWYELTLPEIRSQAVGHFLLKR